MTISRQKIICYDYKYDGMMDNLMNEIAPPLLC
jgi:hypothetical protein